MTVVPIQALPTLGIDVYVDCYTIQPVNVRHIALRRRKYSICHDVSLFILASL